MQTKKWILIAALCTFTQACSTTPNEPEAMASTHLYLDDAFSYEDQLPINEELFVSSDEIKTYVKKRLAPLPSLKEKVETFRQDLFDPDGLAITYNPDANFSPNKVFASKQANCLSLAIFTYVVAKEAKLDGKFRAVSVTENWRVTDDLTTINNHVNIELKSHRASSAMLEFVNGYTIDFYPTWRDASATKTIISKQDIVALFYNNLGANALAQGNYELAYQHFRTATVLSPETGHLWGNLASIYRQQGFMEKAEEVYKHALAISPEELNLKEGLAILYKRTQRLEQANKLYNEIKQKRGTNPYYYVMQAEHALNSGQPNEAKALFKQALKLEKQHTFYLGLAQAALQLNQLDEVEHYLTKGQKLFTRYSNDDLYANKLSALHRYKQTIAVKSN